MAEILSPACELTIGQCAALACLLEVSAPKPGNVHRGADFEDLRFEDFVLSAIAIGPVMERAVAQGVGQTVLAAVEATRQLVTSNTNLGLILLLAPLASVPRPQPLSVGLPNVLAKLTPADAVSIYEAIRLARPGGLGKVADHDVSGAAPRDLLDAMRRAAERDLIARQYVTGFQDVFQRVVPWLRDGQNAGWSLPESIVHAYLRMLAAEPDSLVARKGGLDLAQSLSRLAASVLAAGVPGDETYHAGLADLDFWLRSDGHVRNPGTTADLVGAGLFVLLRENQLDWPCTWPKS